jgi:hypothetical protein
MKKICTQRHMCICLYASYGKRKKITHAQTVRDFEEKLNERFKFTFCGRGSRLFSSAASFVVDAVLAVAAGFFFAAAAGLAAGAELAVSSSLSAVTSGLTTVAPVGFFVIVAELTAGAAVFGTAAVLVAVVIGAVERGSPRILSRTAFSAYSLI